MSRLGRHGIGAASLALVLACLPAAAAPRTESRRFIGSGDVIGPVRCTGDVLQPSVPVLEDYHGIGAACFLLAPDDQTVSVAVTRDSGGPVMAAYSFGGHPGTGRTPFCNRAADIAIPANVDTLFVTIYDLVPQWWEFCATFGTVITTGTVSAAFG